jgi:predicted Rossmann fold flavoprotein
MTGSALPYDVIILGAGAAGMMCAIEAGQRGRRVLLIEHNDAVGKKIRISGGGRCNFTNRQVEPSRFVSQNPRFCYSALAGYTAKDFIAYVERHGIAYHEKKLGQLFCDGSAQQIIDALVADCAAAGVETRLGCEVQGVEKADAYEVHTTEGTFQSRALVVASGGLSIPKLGASDLGYRIAQQFGLPIVPCMPGLVPFKIAGREFEAIADLSGVAFDARVSRGKQFFEESVLITHRGLSGPAILQISSYWDPGQSIAIDLFPHMRMEEKLLQAKRSTPAGSLKNLLGEHLPSRLAQRLCEAPGLAAPLGEIPDKALRRTAESLHRWQFTPADTEGYAKAEVTRGGIDTRALSPKTMEARDVPGLYFIGEAVDVTGWLGGYNFQWAWSSAVAAGRAV